MAQAAIAQIPRSAKPATLAAKIEMNPSTGEPPKAATRTDEATPLWLPESLLFVSCLMLVSCGERAENQGVWPGLKLGNRHGGVVDSRLRGHDGKRRAVGLAVMRP
mgnify:CR=1 FL=1